jgi:hypothetical protein
VLLIQMRLNSVDYFSIGSSRVLVHSLSESVRGEAPQAFPGGFGSFQGSPKLGQAAIAGVLRVVRSRHTVCAVRAAQRRAAGFGD